MASIRMKKQFGSLFYYKINSKSNQSPQSFAINHKNKQNHDLLVCYEGRLGRMYGSYNTIDDFLKIYDQVKPKDRHFHEVIVNQQKVKMYADLDWEYDQVNQTDMLNDFKLLMTKCYHEVFNTELDWDDVVILDASSKEQNKGSLHAIFNTGRVFSKMEDQKIFWLYVKKKMDNYKNMFFLKDKEDKVINKCILDFCPYKSNQLFRMPLSSKFGSSRILKFDDTLYNVKKLLVTNSENSITYEISDDINAEELVKNVKTHDDTYITNDISEIIKRCIPDTSISCIKGNIIGLKYNGKSRRCLINDEIHEKSGAYCVIRGNRLYYRCFASSCQGYEEEIGELYPSEYDRSKNFDINLCYEWLDNIVDYKDLELVKRKIVEYMNCYWAYIIKETKPFIVHQYYDDKGEWQYILQAEEAVKKTLSNKKKKITYQKLVSDKPNCGMTIKSTGKQCSKPAKFSGLCSIHSRMASDEEKIEFKDKMDVAIGKMKTEEDVYLFDPYALWYTSPNRKECYKMAFNPNVNDVQKNRFNIFRGLPYGPRYCSQFKDEDITPILDHIKNIWCKGNAKCYNYVIKWMAHILQKPWVKTCVAIVLKSVPGAGKGVIINHLATLLGTSFFQPISPDDVLGRFTSQLEDKLLIFLDEMVWGGDKQKSGVLKKLITENKHRIERKCLPSYEVDSYLNLIMASNEEWIIPSGAGSRRYLCLDVDGKHAGMSDKNIQQYFKKILNCSTEAFGHYLYTLDLTEYDPRHAPITDALRGQQRKTFDKIMQWWNMVLDRKYIIPDKKFNDRIPLDHLFKVFKEEINDRHTNEKGLYDRIREMCNVEQVSIQCKDGKVQSIGCIFPKIDEAREMFKRCIKDPGWAFEERDIKEVEQRAIFIDANDDDYVS